MSRRFSRFALLAMAVSATAGHGYLPLVGPAPLRFQPPAVPLPTDAVELPPLVTLEPSPKLATPTKEPAPPAPPIPTAPTGAPDMETLVDAALEPPLRIPMVPSTFTNPPPSPPDQGAMAAQMFLKYFTGQAGTNSGGFTIIAPVGFVPPLPQSAPPSSTAKFHTTGPGEP